MLQIDWLGLWRVPFVEFPPARQLEGLTLLALYVLALVLAFAGTRPSWSRFKARRALLVTLCLVTFLLNIILAWHYPIARPPMPDRPQEAVGTPAPLLGSLPILLVGAWFGAGPAMVAGFLGGLARALFVSSQTTQPFEFAFFGLIASFLLGQTYRGRLSSMLRQPMAAGVLARLLIWPLTLPAAYVHASGEPLYALDLAWPLFLSGWLPALVEGVLAGVVGQIFYAALPRLRPAQAARSAPPFARSFNRRLLFTFVPIMLIMIAALVAAVTATTINAATQQAIRQMARDAVSASQDVPFFFQTGQSLISSLASDAQLRSSDSTARQTKLAEGVRAGAFFDEILLTDASGAPTNLYPPGGSELLTEEERTLITRTVSSGAPGISGPQRVATDTLMISFVVPVEDAKGARTGALVGRARLNTNPVMRRALAGLQATLGTGEGFVVDERGRIVLATDKHSDRLMTDWRLDASQKPLAEVEGGQVYVNSVEDGTRRLIYVRPVQGYPWTAVVELPYAAVLGLAAQVSAPLVVLLLILTLVASVAMVTVSRRVTRPLHQLSQATAQIAEGKLDAPMLVRGEDEVGQLGEAFEQMRASLKGRLEDLSLLVRVSQAVASSLDLEQGIPPILEGALEASGARLTRLLLLSRDGTVNTVWKRGDAVASSGRALPGEITPIDQRLAEMAVLRAEPLWVESIARMRGQLDQSFAAYGIRALAVLPVRRLRETTGVLWLAYSEPHHFSETEKDILTTLAGQIDVLVENSRLFHTAESERQRLAAILLSTGDAVVVTSPDDRVLLMNPAAEIAFGVVATRVVGKRVQETVLDPAVVQLLTTSRPDGGPQTGEIILPDGRTLYGSASDIRLDEGPPLGRAAVMRDVSHFKELDAIKSEFVATVSHDLRSPLTYMRGYTSMLPMVGELSPKQIDYVEKIQAGIEQMGELIDDLLDLGRIEAGVGLQRVECVLADVVNDVYEEARSRAMVFNLDLKTEINTQRATLADPALIKRAISNLLDNAMKYTPSGGTITVGLDERADSVIVRVTDSGIGIAPADQGRLFEKFYRVKRRDTIDIKGSGLGLAIVKSIVEWHGGRVWVDSQLGQGSTFYMALPTSTAASPSPVQGWYRNR
jgi:PAS domain S-box-containing protein